MKHQEGYFKGIQNYNIYYQCWLPESNPKAVLLVAHGYAEHSGRYMNVVDFFVPRGYSVYALDHRGHGRSDGKRTHVDAFSDYVNDLKTYFDMVRKENPDSKIFLVGHSMGSVISMDYVQHYQHELAGLITSGGGLIDPEIPETMLGKPPSSDSNDSKPDYSGLSRDPAVIKAYVEDPLVYLGPQEEDFPMVPRLQAMNKEVANIKLPALIMAGDGGTDGARARVFYKLMGSEDKTLKCYKDLMHEIFNEPEHLQVLGDMEAWLEAHL